MTEIGIGVDAVVRLLVAIVLGAVIGFEREASDQPAGLRTHISVALGAALFGVISTLGFTEFESDDRAGTNVQVDVTRVASQVVVGIGFLGAGVIFRQGATVRNITTAASLWVTAAIGLAVGVGDVGVAVLAAGGLIVSLVALRAPRTWIRDHITKRDRQVIVVLNEGADSAGVIGALRRIDGVDLKSVAFGKREGRLTLRVRLEGHAQADIDGSLAAIAGRDDVASLVPAFEVDAAG